MEQRITLGPRTANLKGLFLSYAYELQELAERCTDIPVCSESDRLEEYLEERRSLTEIEGCLRNLLLKR